MLARTALLALDGGIAMLLILLLTSLIQWARERILKIQPDRSEKTLWAVSAVLSLFAIWFVVCMKLAVSV
ncbi:hypothetical protein [Thermococcus nautili]|uniref:hypothetical protein n=1 Tax=Thermococcus nautili TaxID=195522 RepID=UPI0005B294FF|nr:hypothetical protein [Thermococcus nautili]